MLIFFVICSRTSIVFLNLTFAVVETIPQENRRHFYNAPILFTVRCTCDDDNDRHPWFPERHDRPCLLSLSLPPSFFFSLSVFRSFTVNSDGAFVRDSEVDGEVKRRKNTDFGRKACRPIKSLWRRQYFVVTRWWYSLISSRIARRLRQPCLFSFLSPFSL